MALFTSPEDILVTAMSAKQSGVHLNHVVGSLEGVFKKALKKERRLCAFLSGYSANYMKKGLVQLATDYDVTLTYQPDSPDQLQDVLLDDPSFEVSSLLTPGSPREAFIVTDDPHRLEQSLNEELEFLPASYEGINGISIQSSHFDKLTDDHTVWVTWSTVTEPGNLRVYMSKAMFSARNIWRNLLGRARVPLFVKVFLAYSYLMQECQYDQLAYDEMKHNTGKMPVDPAPHIAYGPLCEHRGICGGMAWGFKRLMDEAGVECICVSGYLKPETRIGHMWNLVKLDGQYYHVDTTWNLQANCVYVPSLLQNDEVYRQTHVWEESRFPRATGRRYNYGFIEDFLVENGNDYLDDGANEKYMFPDCIME